MRPTTALGAYARLAWQEERRTKGVVPAGAADGKTLQVAKDRCRTPAPPSGVCA